MPSARGHIVIRRKARDGNDGKGILFVTISYAVSSSSTQTPTEGWQSVIPHVIDNYFLWTRTVTTYSDGTVSTSYSVSRSGKGINSVVIMYCLSSQGVNPPVDGWQFNIPYVSAGLYLWTRTVTTYTDDTTTTSYSVSRNGLPGGKGDPGNDGKSIHSITEYYLASSESSGVTIETPGWTTSMQQVSSSKRYLWNYEKITYTDNSTSIVSPHITGVYGDTGSDGKGIQSITEYYLASSASSGVTIETPGWTTSMQQVSSSKRYLWNYEKITYTDNSTSTVPPHITGVHGDKGDKGEKGNTGDTGEKGDTGDIGPRGYSGCIYRVTLWENGKQYRNDTYLQTNDIKYVDICVDTPISIIGQSTVHAYVCRATHVASNSIPLGHSDYWTEMQSFAPIVTPLLLTQAISADYINCAEIATNAAFIQSLVASQAFIDSLVVKSLDTHPSTSGNKIRIQGDHIEMMNASGLKKCIIKNASIGEYEDLVLAASGNYTSSPLQKVKNIISYCYSAGATIRISDIIGQVNLGWVDKGGTININNINVSFIVPYTNSGNSISMTFSSPGLQLQLIRDGVPVMSWNCGPYSETKSSGSSFSISYSVPSYQRSYTVPEDGQYKLLIRPYMSGSTSCWSWTCSTAAGNISFDVTSEFYFSFNKANYEYTQIGNDGLAQVMGQGFLFSNSTTFIVKRGNYMLRLTASGLHKSINGGNTWISL